MKLLIKKIKRFGHGWATCYLGSTRRARGSP